MSDRQALVDEVLALRPASTALLVVDMQRGFVEPGEPMEVPTARETALPRIRELVVRKRWYDAFAGTPLDGALRAPGVDTLVITGTMTDICVLATVVGAFNREYRITVVEDAVATLWPEIHRVTLDIIGRAYGRVVSTKEVADEMRNHL